MSRRESGDTPPFQRYTLPSDADRTGEARGKKSGEPSKTHAEPPPTHGEGPEKSRIPPSYPARIQRWLLISLGAIAGLAVAVLMGLTLAFYYYSRDLPSTGRLGERYAPPQMTRILARDGTLIGSIFSERRTVVPLDTLPDFVKTAFLAAEDASFYEHRGLNYFGLLRAIIRNLRAGHVRQGGSTITQQVVKNVLLTQERTMERKIKETILAFQIERELSKDQILEMYLNHIYLGHGRYGVEEASRFMFGKHARDIDVAEAATLAGIVASPERYSPHKNIELARKRRHYVLSQMLAKGFMTEAVFVETDRAPIRVAPAAETLSDIAPEFVERARKILAERVGDGALRGGYTLTTTLDPELQNKAREAVRRGLDDYLKRQRLEPPFTLPKRQLWGRAHEGPVKQHRIYAGHVDALDDKAGTIDVALGTARGKVHVFSEERFNSRHLLPSQLFSKGALIRVRVLDDPKELAGEEPLRLALELGPEAALVAFDVATGDVLSLVGSYEALPGSLDRATQARRQPGSSFKPVIYSAALDLGKVTPATLFDFTGGEASPKAAEGPAPKLSLRKGIAQSDNRVAIETLHRVSAGPVIQLAKQLGFAGPFAEGDSLALGAYEVTPLEMARAYSVFATQGVLRTPRFVSKIGSGAGEVALPPPDAGVRVMRPEVAYVMTSLLASVVREGTGQRAQSLGRPVAGKTGTTNQAKDAWFVGFSTDLVVAVWVGFDDSLPLGWGESGARTALPIWVEFMKAATAGKPVTEFSRPNGVTELSIDPATGLLARFEQSDALTEVFVRGTEPTEVAPVAPEEGEPASVPSAVPLTPESGEPRDEDAREPGAQAEGPESAPRDEPEPPATGDPQ
jgi:penicillin-binding protein 1A